MKVRIELVIIPINRCKIIIFRIDAKMETVIEKLKLLMHGNSEYLSLLEGATDVDDVSRDCCLLSQQEMLRKHNYYASKVKYCIKMYTNLNEKLLKDIEMFKM